jgi:hypothetical protein
MFIRTLHYIYMYAGIRGQIPKISLIYGNNSLAIWPNLLIHKKNTNHLVQWHFLNMKINRQNYRLNALENILQVWLFVWITTTKFDLNYLNTINVDQIHQLFNKPKKNPELYLILSTAKELKRYIPTPFILAYWDHSLKWCWYPK